MKTKKLKQVIFSVSILSSVVGVGFLSGKELLLYFANFGWFGVIGCLLAGLIFYVFILLYMNLEFNNHINKKRKNVKNYIKNSYKTIKYVKYNAFFTIYNVILLVCEIVITSAMFSGVESLLHLLSFNQKIIVIFKIALALILTCYLLWFKSNFANINFYLTLFMFFFFFIVYFICLKNAKIQVIRCKFDIKTFINPFIYVGMNILTCCPIFRKISQNFQCKKDLKKVAFISSLVFTFCLVSFVVFIVLFGKTFVKDDMIILSVVRSNSELFYYLYFVVLVVGILTTLFSCSLGGVEILSEIFSENFSIICFVWISFIMSFLGFDKIINYLYPMLGILCLCFLLLFFAYTLICRKRCKIV